jgi:DNA-directed RNA polymerase subunit RPC12/RpoP
VRNILTSVPGKKEKLPLSVTHPELAKEADGWDPKEFTSGSGKTKTWKCEKGHLWSAKIYQRAGSTNKKPTGCPVCNGRIIVVGFNDLGKINPRIAAEADGWNPTTVGAGGGTKDWVCASGHKWRATISNRVFFDSNCPVCLNQKIEKGFNDLATTHPDIAQQADGWDPTTIIAGNAKTKLKWKCPRGHTWNAVAWARTRARPTGCPTCSNRVLLIGFNDLATTNPDLAQEAFGWDPTTILFGSHKRVKWKCKLGHIWETTVNGRSGRTRGCPYCSNTFLLVGFNDLASRFPEIAKQADGWDPTTFVYGSDKKLPWKCEFGHQWKTSITKRTGVEPTNCPICSGRTLLKGFNDLATTFPEIASEADGWNATEVSSGSHTKVRWKCKEGHTWEISPHGRKRGTVGCPTCASSGYDINSDGYLYFLEQNDWEMYQIGITNVPKVRLGKHKKLDWELIEIRGPMDGQLAREVETAILEMLKAKGADLANEKIAGKFDGYSEAWSKSTFVVGSIKELMRLTEEFENELKN